MDQNTDRPVGEIAPSEQKPHLGVSRRALLRAGTGAAPVLLTLASSPVAATTTCTVASSFVSVATFKSRNPHATSIQCSKFDANYWRATLANTMPTPAYFSGTVSDLLGSTGSTYNTHTLKQLFDLPSIGGTTVSTTGELGVLQHLASLALHYNAGYLVSAGVFNLAYIQGIWANYKSNGNRYRLPASNIDWGDSEVIAWLRFLMNPIVLP
jgi:hypothetical protein